MRTDTPSGLPVPRFVALKHNQTNCRIGPSFNHDIRFTYQRKAAPVLVIAETVDHWRKVRDRDGAECWAHKSVLVAPSHVFSRQSTPLFAKPQGDARRRADLGPGLLVKVEQRKKDWVRVTVRSDQATRTGWARAKDFWGLKDQALQAAAPQD